MTPLPTAHALLTADQERARAATIRAGRRARLLAQRHLAAHLRRELPFTSWPRSSPLPSSARTWPSQSCSSPPSCASRGPVSMATASPPGSATAAL